MNKKNKWISLVLVGVALLLTIVVLFLGFAKCVYAQYTEVGLKVERSFTIFDYIFVKNDAESWSQLLGGLKHNGGLIAAFAFILAVIVDLAILFTIKFVNKEGKISSLIFSSIAAALLITVGILALLSKSFFIKEFSAEETKKYLADNIKLGPGAIASGVISIVSALIIFLGFIVYPGFGPNKTTKKAKRR